jgi:hypothetical protein
MELTAKVLWPQFEAVHFSVGQIQSRLNARLDLENVQDAEFQVFSQFGGDGIIQYMVSRIQITQRTFVELGAGSYRESNTRFLVQNDAWEGLVVDAGTAHLAFLNTPWIRWRHRVYGQSAFITAENVNSIISRSGFRGNIGLLSIDLDGNDYWILESIDVVTPQILVLEYNSVFGAEHAVVVPYDPAFMFGKADPSQLYYGASLAALSQLAAAKGYQLVGSDRAGVNAFYVRRDVGTRLPQLTVEEAWVPSQHRMPTDPEVWLPFSSLQRDRLRLIGDLPLYDVTTGTTCAVRDRYEL